jgi:hypothetical protein
MHQSEPTNNPDNNTEAHTSSIVANEPTMSKFDLMMAYRALIGGFIRSDCDEACEANKEQEAGELELAIHS